MTGTLIGFALGYVLGAKTGPERLEELRRAWEAIRESDEFQGLVANGVSLAQRAVAQGGAVLSQQLESLTSGESALGGILSRLSPGDARDSRGEGSGPDELNGLLATGMAWLANYLERGGTDPSGCGR